MNTPKLRFPGFRDDWRVQKLGDVTKWASGGTPPKDAPSYWGGDIPWISASSMYGSDFSTSERTLTETGLRHGSKMAKRGSILLLVRGSMLFSTIPVGVASRDVAFNQDVKAITSESLDHSYLFYFLKASEHKLLSKVVGTGIGAGKLDLGDLLKLKIAVPEKAEQQKIVEFLSLVDEKVTSLQRKIDVLKRYKRGASLDVFVQNIRFKNDDNQAYPAWHEKTLSELEAKGDVELGRGEVISKIDILASPGDYPIYSSSIKNNGLFGSYGKYMFDEELISWSIDGGGNFFYRPKRRFSVTNVSGWLRVLSPSINCLFLARQLQYLHERLVFDYQSKAHPSVIRNMYKVQLPSTEEQQKIADFLSALDDKIILEESKLEQAKQFKKSLLQQMFV